MVFEPWYYLSSHFYTKYYYVCYWIKNSSQCSWLITARLRNLGLNNTSNFSIIIPNREVTELRLGLRKVGTSDWFYTSSSDNFESEVITKIERFDRAQPERATTSCDLSAGESPRANIILLHVTYVCVISFIFDWLKRVITELYFYYFIRPALNS